MRHITGGGVASAGGRFILQIIIRKEYYYMQLKYKFGADGLMTDIWFDGLDESEPVTSIGQTMAKLRVINPAVVFTKEVKAGLFDEVSDKEYSSMLSSIECIAMLWRYTGDRPVDRSTRMEVNVLTLLANAINLLTQQNIHLKNLIDIYHGPDLPDIDDPDFQDFCQLVEPDFAPDPTDEETLAEIADAVAREAAMNVLEREWELLAAGEEMEVDDFGNPIVKDMNKSSPDGSDPDLDVVEENPSDINSDNKPNSG